MIHIINLQLSNTTYMFLYSEDRPVVSDSLQPHGLQPTRLLCPWDFPGNSTGVDCHFPLQRIFPTQGLNPGLPHCRQTLYRLSLGVKVQTQLEGAQEAKHYFRMLSLVTNSQLLNQSKFTGCLSSPSSHLNEGFQNQGMQSRY